MCFYPLENRQYKPTVSFLTLMFWHATVCQNDLT
jgi:hypothetical protein